MNIVSPKRSAAWRQATLALRCEFPHLALRYFANEQMPDTFGPHRDGQRVLVSVQSWLSPASDPRDLDPPADDCATVGPFSIWLVSGPASPDLLAVAAVQVVTRCQRHLPMCNRHSDVALFDRIRVAHRAAHDLDKPLVAADFAHAVDTRRWVLRLEPEASLATQVAALFHDIERLVSDGEGGIAPQAPTDLLCSRTHAAASAAITRDILRSAGAPDELVERVSELVATHGRVDRDDPEVVLLNEADALSFFSLGASRFLSCMGRRRTAVEVRHAWNGLGPRGRSALATVRHHPVVAAMLPSSLSTSIRWDTPSGAVA